MLRLRASPAKSVTMNSAPFPVTPGAAYRMWVAARVPEASINSTLIYLIFLGTDGAEVSRVALRLRPQPVALGSTTLGSDGRYYFLSKGLTAGRYSIVVDYDGDETQVAGVGAFRCEDPLTGSRDQVRAVRSQPHRALFTGAAKWPRAAPRPACAISRAR